MGAAMHTPCPSRVKIGNPQNEQMFSGLLSKADLAVGSRREEFDEMIVDAIGRFLLQVVAGRERLRIDEVARELAPHRGKFLGRRCASRSPQYQKRHPDL